MQACYFGAEGAPSDPAKPARRPFIVGVAGGTASGKSSVCAKIVERLQADDTLVRAPHQAMNAMTALSSHKP